MNIATNNSLLVGVLWPKTKERIKGERFLVLMIAGSLLLALSAKIQIHLLPVPITMQTMVVLLIGLAFGWRLGGATYLLYLLEGMVGLPVFAKGAGIPYMLGPTGGYLLGMFLACLVVGKLAEQGWDKNDFSTAAAMLVGNIVIYVPGLLWLGTVVGWSKPVLEWGLYPFIYGDILKVLLAAFLVPTVWKVLNWTNK